MFLPASEKRAPLNDDWRFVGCHGRKCGYTDQSLPTREGDPHRVGGFGTAMGPGFVLTLRGV